MLNPNEEEWRPLVIKGKRGTTLLEAEARYAISSHGWIARYHFYFCIGTMSYRGEVKPLYVGYRFSRLCPIFDASRGYYRVNLAGKAFRVHRLVAITFLPPVRGHHVVNHIDGVKKNNAASNLEWSNTRKNTKHAYDLGLLKTPCQKGANNNRAKLTEEHVREIRQYLSHLDTRQRLEEVAEMFGITVRHAQKIRDRKVWSHVPYPVADPR